MIHRFLQVALVLVAFSCASSGQRERGNLRDLVRLKQFDGALDLLKGSSFYQKKTSRLLKHVEMGLVYHYKRMYAHSIISLQKAKELHETLYTISVTKKAATYVGSDLNDDYRFEVYERSLVHFYLALNRVLISQQGFVEEFPETDESVGIPRRNLLDSEKREYLMNARAEIVSWDTYLESIRQQRLGKSVFKDDLLAKVFGAHIHEMMNTRNDRQIALLLYRKGYEILLKNYNAYETFNHRYKKFREDFKSLPSLSISNLKNNYITETPYQEELKDFLIEKILTLTSQIRPSEFNSEVRRLNAEKFPLAKIKKQKESNFLVVYQDSLIGLKKPKVEYYSLARALAGKKATPEQKKAARFGASVITLFAAAKLGLLPPPTHYNPIGMEFGVRLGLASAEAVAISFQVPVIKKSRQLSRSTLFIYDLNDQLLKEVSLPVINPLGDIAEEATLERSMERVIRLGSRLAWKHIVAITTAMATYNSVKNSSGDYIAKQAALLQYIALSKAIQVSEQADTRYWSTLPAQLKLSQIYLPPGKYRIKTQKEFTGEIDSLGMTDHGEVEIRPGQKMIFNIRV